MTTRVVANFIFASFYIIASYPIKLVTTRVVANVCLTIGTGLQVIITYVCLGHEILRKLVTTRVVANFIILYDTIAAFAIA